MHRVGLIIAEQFQSLALSTLTVLSLPIWCWVKLLQLHGIFRVWWRGKFLLRIKHNQQEAH